jgi:hypothetical protein
MGQINLIHDESWRAARLVVNHFEARLEDAELTESFHVIRGIMAEAMKRFLERHERELHRLAKKENERS